MTMLILSNRELETVAGGLTWELLLAGSTALIGGAYLAGQAVGEAVYHLTH